MTLTADRLRELIHYDQETGAFTWRVDRARARAGQAAGCWRDDGYLVICVDGKLYRASRLAWLYVKGSMPTRLIDHRDGDTRNNRFKNLRQATATVSSQNRGPVSRATISGLPGVEVRVRKSGTRYRVRVRDGKKDVLVGTFRTPEAASAAYIEAKAKLHRGFARRREFGIVPCETPQRCDEAT